MHILTYVKHILLVPVQNVKFVANVMHGQYKIGFIGFGNQVNRLLILIKKSIKNFDLICFHSFKISDCLTNNFKNIIDCDVVFITSPNNTHFEYIKRLLNSSNV